MLYYKYMNYGLQLEKERRPKDWSFGGISGMEMVVYQTNRNWDSFLPVYEPQFNKFTDTFSCVTFAALNCIETMHLRKYGVQINLSDRFTAVLSGTKYGFGNNFWDVSESIRKIHGCVDDVVCPFLSTMRKEDYFSPISEEAKKEGLKFFEENTIQKEYVSDDPENLWEALQFSPIKVAIHAYGLSVDGILQRTELPGNHAVMLYGGEYGKFFKIYDHYDRCFKTLAWNSRFWGAMRYDILKKNTIIKPMKSFTENSLFQLVEGDGGFYLFAAGRMYHDDTAKILASWTVRNSVNGIFNSGAAGTLLLKDLEGVDVFNLKNEKI